MICFIFKDSLKKEKVKHNAFETEFLYTSQSYQFD